MEKYQVIEKAFRQYKDYPKGSCYIIDRTADGEYQLIGKTHCGQGQDALYCTGTKDHCINEFYERTKRASNEHRQLYIIDEVIRFQKYV